MLKLSSGIILLMLLCTAMPANANNSSKPPEKAKFVEFPSVEHDPEKLASTEFLPVEKFDEYLTGYTPPHPWYVVGQTGEDVSVLLQAWGESPVTGNTISGKGIILRDNSQSSGNGTGFAIDFPPPPAGAAQLCFDFYNETFRANAPALFCNLGDQLQLVFEPDGKVFTIDSSGSRQIVGKYEAKFWYHVSIILESGKASARISLSKHSGKKTGIGSLGSMAAFNEIPLSKKTNYPDSLAFTLSGKPAAQGSWRIDNILMAGEVTAARQRWWPFKQLPLSELAKSEKKVFTYNFPPFGASQRGKEDPVLSWTFNAECLSPVRPRLETNRKGAGAKIQYMPLPRVQRPELGKWESLSLEMLDDVKLAKAQGNDGFLMDFNQNTAGGWNFFNLKTSYTMDAAEHVGAFKVIPAVYAGKDKSQTPQDYANHSIYKKALAHPALYREKDNEPVISMWGAERKKPEWWKSVLETFKDNGTPVKLLAQFNNYSGYADYKDVAWGMADWGPRQIQSKYTTLEKYRTASDIIGTPIVLQDVRTRNCWLFESSNSSTFRMLWEYAINNNSDLAIINTWNDFSEQAQMPATAIGYTLYDLSAYYIQWFKTGKQPEIIRDTLYYFYRRQHTDAPQNHGDKWTFRNNRHIANEVELLAFLKEPGTLTIEIDGKVFSKDAPAGITSFKVPLPYGKRFVPYFALKRGEKKTLEGKGRYTVFERVEFPNLLYQSGVITK